MKKIIEIIKKKWLRDTFYTVLLIAIIFAVYYLINFAVEKINAEDLDLTSDKIYSISDFTRTKLGNLDKEVEIDLLNMSQYEYIIDFSNKYTQVNSNIKIERVDDLTSRPDLTNQYGLQDTDSLIVIKSGERETTLAMNDLYTYDYTTRETIDLTEEAITNAIIEVTIEEKPKIYFLTGHNNYSDNYFSIIKDEITSEANEVDSLNILTAGSVPEDCDCLVITTLKEDLLEAEKDKILEYANNGGKILLLQNSNILGIETPNFNAILDLYGFTISNGIIMEQDPNKMVYGSPEFVISQVEDIINENINMNMNICVIDAGKIIFKDNETLENLGVTYKTIARTSDSAFLRTNLKIESASKKSEDEDASNAIVGALVTRKLENDKEAQMIVFSNTVFATNQTINMYNSYVVYANDICNNNDAVINSISYLTQRTDTITIRKNADDVSYTVTEAQHKIIVAIIFIVPTLVIIAGIVVWQIRRRKK